MSRPRPSRLILASVVALGFIHTPSAPASAAPLQGTVAIDGTTNSVSGLGDVNGDGYDDLGAPGGHVIWGDPNPEALSLTAPLGTRAAKFTQADPQVLPAKVGDLDDDGFDDFALAFGQAAKGIYVVYGAPGRDGLAVVPGARVATIKTGSFSAAPQPLGDFNGDGYDDLLVRRGTGTAADPNLRGGAAIVLGGPRLTMLDANAAGPRTMLINGTTGCKIVWFILLPVPSGYTCNVAFGGETAIGDFDGDGRADLYYDTLRDDGRYILLGRPNAGGTVGAGTPGSGIIKVGQFGGWTLGTDPWRPRPAGDLNGDGKDDLMFARPYGGAPYNDHAVYLGRAGLTGGTIDAQQPSFTIRVSGLDQVVSVGDLGGDAVDDLAVATASGSSPHPNVATFNVAVLQGLQSAPAGSAVPSITPASGPTLTPLLGVPQARYRYPDYLKDVVRAAGDVDGDGLADLVVGADGERAVLVNRAADRVAPEVLLDRAGGALVRPFATVTPNLVKPGSNATIAVTMQEAATVTFTVKTKADQTVGSFERELPKWETKLPWDGKLGGEPLAGGAYVLAITPRDAAGNVGATRTVPFSVEGSTSGGGGVGGGPSTELFPPERFASGKWAAYGSASLLAANESITLTSQANESGALVWPLAFNPDGLEFVLSYTASGGNGQAEGATLSFIPEGTVLPSPGSSPLGGNGGGLGIGGIGATTVAIDANRNPGDPAAAFVGIAESSTANNLAYSAWADPGIRLRGTNVVLKVAYKAGVLSVYVNDRLRLRRTTPVPSRSYLAISGSTGSIFQTQKVGGFRVAQTP